MLTPLTQIAHRTRERSPVLVNFANVTYISTIDLPKSSRPGVWNDETKTYGERIELPKETVTCISFTAGLHEEPDSVWVAETLDEIKELCA